MYNKFIAGFATSAMVFSFVVAPVAAQTTTPTTKKQERMMKQQERIDKQQEKKSENIERLKEKANKEIDRRVKSLTHLLELISKAKKLSAEQKSSLSAQVQAEITSLTALKAKIAADTDLATLRLDVASIKKSYRIFALFVPKIHIIIKAERTLDLADKSSSLAAKLEQRITSLPEGSPEITQLQTLLNAMKKQIADARTQAQSAINTAVLLTPEGYPANKTSLMNARKSLRDAHRNLMGAHKTGKLIMKKLRKDDISAAPIATITDAPAVSPSAVPTQ